MIVKKTLKCPKCGKEYTISVTESEYRRGRYRKHCSRKCANSKTQSKETREKISESLKRYYSVPEHLEKFVKRTEDLIIHTCRNCGKHFNIRDKRDTKSLSYCSL